MENGKGYRERKPLLPCIKPTHTILYRASHSAWLYCQKGPPALHSLPLPPVVEVMAPCLENPQSIESGPQHRLAWQRQRCQ